MFLACTELLAAALYCCGMDSTSAHLHVELLIYLFVVVLNGFYGIVFCFRNKPFFMFINIVLLKSRSILTQYQYDNTFYPKCLELEKTLFVLNFLTVRNVLLYPRHIKFMINEFLIFLFLCQ